MSYKFDFNKYGKPVGAGETLSYEARRKEGTNPTVKRFLSNQISRTKFIGSLYPPPAGEGMTKSNTAKFNPFGKVSKDVLFMSWKKPIDGVNKNNFGALRGYQFAAAPEFLYITFALPEGTNFRTTKMAVAQFKKEETGNFKCIALADNIGVRLPFKLDREYTYRTIIEQLQHFQKSDVTGGEFSPSPKQAERAAKLKPPTPAPTPAPTP